MGKEIRSAKYSLKWLKNSSNLPFIGSSREVLKIAEGARRARPDDGGTLIDMSLFNACYLLLAPRLISHCPLIYIDQTNLSVVLSGCYDQVRII